MPDIRYEATFASPVGYLGLASDGAALTELRFLGPRASAAAPGDEILREAVRQLHSYFDGTLRDFDLPLDPAGTDFQRLVWKELVQIPFGSTASYADVAARIGRPTATRAVGAANGRNPIAIVVPCHRVIGRDGTLTGFGGGLETKQWLLDHETKQHAELTHVGRDKPTVHSEMFI